MGEAPESIVLVETLEDVKRLTFSKDAKLAYLTQTTLSLDDTAILIEALKNRFPQIVAPKTDDICYATQNRQDAVKELCAQCDLILVVGSNNSSNSQRLVEVARNQRKPAFLIERAEDIQGEWIKDRDVVVGLTAGASAPEDLVQGCLNFLSAEFGATIEPLVVKEEHVTFALPREVRA
jgi:4-hydroxy-3-methylbut-2-enyl diphosphate reductase